MLSPVDFVMISGNDFEIGFCSSCNISTHLSYFRFTALILLKVSSWCFFFFFNHGKFYDVSKVPQKHASGPRRWAPFKFVANFSTKKQMKSIGHERACTPGSATIGQVGVPDVGLRRNQSS